MPGRCGEENADAPLPPTSDLRHAAEIPPSGDCATRPRHGAHRAARIRHRRQLQRTQGGSARRGGGALTRILLLLRLLAIAGTALLFVGPALAEPPQIAAKRAEAERVLAEIQSLDAELEGAVEAYNGATEQLAAIDRERAINARHLTLARRNLVVSQRRLGDRLRAIYMSDQEDSTLAVLLGSHSLGEFVDRIETISSVSSQDVQVLGEVERFKKDVTARAARLKAAHARQEEVVAQRAAAKREIEAGLEQRRRLAASIKDEIARLEAEERARQERLRIEAEQRLAAERAARERAAEAAQQEEVVGASAVTPE